MRCVAAVLIVHVMALIVPTLSAAQSTPSVTVPRLIQITGVFRPVDGQPPSAVETVTVSVYADADGGLPVWQERQTVAIDKTTGRFTLLLGATDPAGIPPEVFASGEAQWMSLWFERPGEAEQARFRIASVPYALKASDAETLGGRPASAYVLAPAAGQSEQRGRSEAEASTIATPGPIANLVQAGTTNFLAKYVNDADVGNSAVYEAGGKVGVGTTNPSDTMSVRFTNTTGQFTGYAVQNLGNTNTSYSGMLFFDHTNALGLFQGFNNVTHEYRINNIARNDASQFDGSINFMTGNAERMRIDPFGRVMIGTTSTSLARLRVATEPGGSVDGIYGETTVTGGWGVRGFAANGIGVYGLGTDNYGVYASSTTGRALHATSGGPVIATFAGTGNVGIGTTSPADKLHVAGDIRVGTGATGCVKDADGTVISGVCSSDRRLKQDVTPFGRSLETVARLQPVFFSWRSNEFPEHHFGNARSFGLIAQDVEAVLPDLVTTDTQGYKAVRYNQLPLYMLQAIKELKAENDSLKHQLHAQEERLRRLEQLARPMMRQ